jgi:hypothetical protein
LFDSATIGPLIPYKILILSVEVLRPTDDYAELFAHGDYDLGTKFD